MVNLLAGTHGDLDVAQAGRGEPVTVFAHGLGGSIATTRPFSSGVEGTRVFFHFAAHGASHESLPEWNYDVLADELDDVARSVNATRALGVSMGAGAILRLLAHSPKRFERVALVMPAVLDSPRESPGLVRYRALATAASNRDVDAIRAYLAAEVPPQVPHTETLAAWLDAQATSFATPGMAQALRELPHHAPLDDLASLREVDIPVLILAQQGDDVHPVASAERLAQALPNAQLEVFDASGLLWGHRTQVRQVVGSFFNTAP